MFLFNYNNIRYADELFKDVVEGLELLAKNPGSNKNNKYAKLYASSKSLPASVVEEGTKVALECFYKI